jgi:hypothetical protein
MMEDERIQYENVDLSGNETMDDFGNVEAELVTEIGADVDMKHLDDRIDVVEEDLIIEKETAEAQKVKERLHKVAFEECFAFRGKSAEDELDDVRRVELKEWPKALFQ